MFETFKGLGQLGSILRNLPKLQEQMAEMSEKMAQISVEGDAGAGMVKVKANGKFEITACIISDEAITLNDKEMLEDLIKSATNAALSKAREAVQQATANVATNMGLPPGMKLPGMD